MTQPEMHGWREALSELGGGTKQPYEYTSPLTLQELKAMPADTVFARGKINDPRICREPVRWVAVRRTHYDWAIYYHYVHQCEQFIANYGDKIFTKEIIRRLVACTDEAYVFYAL